MKLIFAFMLLGLGIYLLFLCSGKQRHKKNSVKLKRLLQSHFRLTRCMAFILFILGAVILTRKYGFSIGLVSWWIFATPLTLLLIFYLNPMSAPEKNCK